MSSRRVAATAVIQVKRGIGDVIWHLPFIRAIAAAAPGGRVTFLAPPTSQARDLLQAEPCVADVLYFEHGGSELRRAVNMIRLAALLRRGGFDALWILDRTLRPAVAGLLAGIPQRIGLGLGPQRLFITNGGIDRSHFHDHPIEWLTALMWAMKVPFATTEAELRVPDAALSAVAAKFCGYRRPWVVLGLGASHPDKDWPDEQWVELISLLRRRAGTVFLIGGAANVARADKLVAAATASNAINACDLPLIEAAALLRQSDVFVGPSSAPLNLAAASAIPAIGLFGSTPVLDHSKFIHAIVPDGGPRPDGMRRIAPSAVLARLAPFLDHHRPPR